MGYILQYNKICLLAKLIKKIYNIVILCDNYVQWVICFIEGEL